MNRESDQLSSRAEAGPLDLASADEFSRWIMPSWSAMAALAVRMTGDSDAEDVLQEALIVAWRKRRQFDPKRGSARAWLLALTADQGRKARRRWRRRGPLELAEGAPLPNVIDSRIDVERAVQRLSRRQKLAVDLYYYVGLPVEEVAAVMRCAPGTVKSTLSDARSRLRAELGEERR